MASSPVFAIKKNFDAVLTSHPLHHPAYVYLVTMSPDGQPCEAPLLSSENKEFYLPPLEAEAFRHRFDNYGPAWQFYSGGVWIELPEIWEGLAFYYLDTFPLPDLSKYGRVNLYNGTTLKGPLQLRQIASIDFRSNGSQPRLSQPAVERWMKFLYSIGKIKEGDYLQASPSAPREIYHPHLVSRTKSFSYWNGVTLPPKNAPTESVGYWLEAPDVKPGVYVFYPSNQELPEGSFRLNIYSGNDFKLIISNMGADFNRPGRTVEEFVTMIKNHAVSSQASGLKKPRYLEVLPSKNEISFHVDERLRRDFLTIPSNVIEMLGSDPIKTTQHPEWQTHLPEGFWLRIPSISALYQWVGLDENITRIPNEEMVEIFESVYPNQKLLVRGTMHTLRPKRRKTTTIRSILKATKGLCPEIMSKISKANQRRSNK